MQKKGPFLPLASGVERVLPPQRSNGFLYFSLGPQVYGDWQKCVLD